MTERDNMGEVGNNIRATELGDTSDFAYSTMSGPFSTSPVMNKLEEMSEKLDKIEEMVEDLNDRMDDLA